LDGWAAVPGWLRFAADHRTVATFSPNGCLCNEERRSMANYYVNQNAQSNGDHEVHRDPCSWMPDVANRTYLGSFDNCQDAVRAAKAHYTQVNGCKHCSPACHTT
jgi:hypothetical protein